MEVTPGYTLLTLLTLFTLLTLLVLLGKVRTVLKAADEQLSKMLDG